MPWPRWARSRLSRKSVARDCHGCSSRRTISSPTRAELRQCTRRRSSPRRYSRTVTSSALPVANARGRLSPEPVQAPPSGIGGSGTVRGVTVSGTVVWKERPSSTRPNGSLTRTRHRPDLEAAAHVGAHLVGHVPAPALADAVEHEPRAGAEHVGHVVLQQQHAARACGPRW